MSARSKKLRPPSRFDMRSTEETLDRIEQLVRRKEPIGYLRQQFRWGINLSEPAPGGGGMGERKSNGPSRPTENAASDARRRSVYMACKEAEALLESAFGTLEKALGGQPSRGVGDAPGEVGSFLTRSEQAESQAMMKKRSLRGEGYGS